ncbi:MAG: PhzF family phenazine biosynthesis protein [Pseudotabrizicola sp.]|uniref:PhzF family phenazine biosynthesis protein n=1 Tax=Pseudotabrizicola sp. TaxID=2939647 RepID=UPI0027163C64|nr:PhzF family phenazine biosynthesis protein [Pseudotabrizicola sp.]MDO9637676.1 PhzF family phenazine biosynthesis protein [Pseudotabrizicola sp.]
MKIQRIAAFSHDGKGGNPAGVVLLDATVAGAEMARVAADVGYSETAFAVALDASRKNWQVRYFSPESEVPFCGHATIALGAVLGQTFGPGTYALTLNTGSITVETDKSGDEMTATLLSPPTHSEGVTPDALHDALTLFQLTPDDLDPRLPPARIHGGADHLVLPLRSRARLAAMAYDLDHGRMVMRKHGLVTVMLVFVEADQTFVARNAFASGGVFEDPATGAAAAAFAGYLRDQGWPHGGSLTIRQGEDMGSPSLISVSLDTVKGAPVRVSGTARRIDP